jgi:DNA modification methylase
MARANRQAAARSRRASSRDRQDADNANGDWPAQAAPATQPGDLWLLGRHRLLCGDATSAADVERARGPTSPLVMVTDPPYGVNYDPTWRAILNGAQRRTLRVLNDDNADWTAAYRLFAGDVAYVWHAGVHAAESASALRAAGFHLRGQIVWAKTRHVLSRGHYHWQHEPCWYAVRRGATASWSGDRKQKTLWTIANASGLHANVDDARTAHSAQKPVECMLRAIRNHGGSIDAAVYDPFLGSGTTIIAAEKLGRRCVGLELCPAYCDIIVDRWQRFTGRRARRRPA